MGIRLPIRLMLVQTYNPSHIDGLSHKLRFFQRFLNVVPSTIFATSFGFILSLPGMPLSHRSCFPLQGMLYSDLVSTYLFGRYTCRVLDYFCSLKPIGKKPLTLTFYFQLVDQYQPIALSGIHWWQSIKRSNGS